MAEEVKKLTAGEIEKAKAWLEQRLANQPCPICTNPDWLISNLFGFVPLYSAPPPGGVGQIHGSSGYPVLVFFCKRCGFVRMHNAIIAGVVEPDPPKQGGQHGT